MNSFTHYSSNEKRVESFTLANSKYNLLPVYLQSHIQSTNSLQIYYDL